MLLFLLLPRWLEGKIPIENMPIGTVDKGPIEISIAATGKLVPLSEEIIVCRSAAGSWKYTKIRAIRYTKENRC